MLIERNFAEIDNIYNDKIIFSLTTIPVRLQYCIENLNIMIRDEIIPKNATIELNLPEVFNRTNEKYPVPIGLSDRVIVYRTEDIGPITKILPTLQRYDNSDKIIICIDDDCYYSKKDIYKMLNLSSIYNNKYVINGVLPNNILSHIYNKNITNKGDKINLNNSYIHHIQSYFIRGFASVLYPTKIVKSYMIKEVLNVMSNECNNSDDLIISIALNNYNIPILHTYVHHTNNDYHNLESLKNIQSHKNIYKDCSAEYHNSI